MQRRCRINPIDSIGVLCLVTLIESVEVNVGVTHRFAHDVVDHILFSVRQQPERNPMVRVSIFHCRIVFVRAIIIVITFFRDEISGDFEMMKLAGSINSVPVLEKVCIGFVLHKSSLVVVW